MNPKNPSIDESGMPSDERENREQRADTLRDEQISEANDSDESFEDVDEDTAGEDEDAPDKGM